MDDDSTSRELRALKAMLKQNGYSEQAVEEILRWYESSKRKKVRSF